MRPKAASLIRSRAAARVLAACFLMAAPASAGAAAADVLAANIDPSVKPSDDFFLYANGAWLARHPIPPSEATWGIGNLVRDELMAKLRAICEEAASKPAADGGDARKIGDFWSTAMDEAKADAAGLGPLQAELVRIDAIETAGAALDVSFALRPLGVETFCGVWVGQDEKRSDEMAVHLTQGGLGLPERDFYFNPEEGTAAVRREYTAHLTRLLVMLGRPAAEATPAAERVMAFETALAKASRKLEDLRNAEKNYHRMTPAEVTARHTPAIDWTARLSSLSLRPEHVIVGQPEFFSALDPLLAATPPPVLRDYLRLRLVATYAAYLGSTWQDADFAFNGRVLAGQKEPRPRWKRVLESQELAMGMMLGRQFVREYFPAEEKQRYVALVEQVRGAFRDRIGRLDWMSDATKAKAREKLDRLSVKVGYPDRWKDDSALVAGRESWAANMMHAARWQFADMISKFGRPVDRGEWEMPPQIYNAYYQASNNEIVLPAAIFTVPGVRDGRLDDAVVYGYAAASTIGHEITHGFDDEGRRFDADGNLSDWWTAGDAAGFEKRAAVLVKQFDAIRPLPDLPINGEASLGENLADYGGVRLALDAFKKTDQFRNGEAIGGFTPLQRFFLGYALAWIYQERPETLRTHLLSDVHAPPHWRVNVPLSNLPEFYEAFAIPPGSPMWREPGSRVEVW